MSKLVSDCCESEFRRVYICYCCHSECEVKEIPDEQEEPIKEIKPKGDAEPAKGQQKMDISEPSGVCDDQSLDVDEIQF